MLVIILYLSFTLLCAAPYLYIKGKHKCSVQEYRNMILTRKTCGNLDDSESVVYASDSFGLENTRFCLAHACSPVIFAMLLGSVFIHQLQLVHRIFLIAVSAPLLMLYLYYAIIYLNYYFARVIVTTKKIMIYSILTRGKVKCVYPSDTFSLNFARRGYTCTSFTINGRRYLLLYQINSIDALIKKSASTIGEGYV